MWIPDRISKCQWKHAITSFTKLADKLSAIQTGEKPCDEIIHYTNKIINRIHFLLLEPEAPIMTFGLYMKLILHIFDYNLPTLILRHLEYVGFEERKRYVACILNGILLARKHGIIKTYVDRSQYLQLLLHGHLQPQFTTYCGTLLIKLIEQASIREMVINSLDLMALLKFPESDSFLVQGQCLRTLQKCFNTAYGPELPYNIAEFITQELLNLICQNENLFIRCMALETLAELVYTHSQIRTDYLPSSEYMTRILNRLLNNKGSIKRAALTFLSVYCKVEEPMPYIIQKHNYAILESVKCCLKEGFSGRIYCPMAQIYARLSTGSQYIDPTSGGDYGKNEVHCLTELLNNCLC